MRPKPLVEIGGRPILWHIMKIYAAHGITRFIICCGYKGVCIKEYFHNYFMANADMTIDLASNELRFNNPNVEPWQIQLVDTGEETMTGGRLRRVGRLLGNETFCMTYGDGVADVDITAAIAWHRSQRVLATLTATRPPGRFGAFTLGAGQSRITNFNEKPDGDGAWINGGFFVLEPKVIEYIEDDTTVWEREPLERLAQARQLSAYLHEGFWQPMDTLRDRMYLERLWNDGAAPWKVWQ